MECPKCGFVNAEDRPDCQKCGIIFKKYEESQLRWDINPPPAPQSRPKPWPILKGLVLWIPDEVNPFIFGGRALVFLILFIWGWRFILTPMESNYVGYSFLHNINLPFHEAGHIIFSFFGRFIMVLGGSMAQILMPIICMVTFLIQKNPFAASVGLWWTGENFMDIAPYINDARDLELMLLGGVTGKEVDNYHDWEYLLGKLGWLEYDHTIAHLSYKFGTLLMLTAFVWGGWQLYRQWQVVKEDIG